MALDQSNYNRIHSKNGVSGQGTMEHYAHSLPNAPEKEWQELAGHLEETAKAAERFAERFAAGWGRIAGLWHDAGKYQRAFQQYIREDPFGACER